MGGTILPALRIHFPPYGSYKLGAEDRIMDWLIVVGVLALWWLLQGWLLPRLGVPT
jgi:hypothetical protein